MVPRLFHSFTRASSHVSALVRLITFSIMASGVTSPTLAQTQRFCLSPVIHDTAPLPTMRYYVPGAAGDEGLLIPLRYGETPIMRLQENALSPLSAGGVAPFAYADYLTTPQGEIFTTGPGMAGHLLRFDPVAGHFTSVLREGTTEPIPARTLGWSTPLQTLLIADGGSTNDRHRASISRFSDGALTPLEGVDGWITHITDIPDLGLTVLISEHRHDVYVIDAAQRLHGPGRLDLPESRSISHIDVLPDPTRLAIASHNTNHLFLMALTHTDGVWHPADTPITGDVLATLDRGVPTRGFFRHVGFSERTATYYVYGFRFENALHRWRARRSDTVRAAALGLYRVASGSLVQIDETDPAVLADLPFWLRRDVAPGTEAPVTQGLGGGLTLVLDEGGTFVRTGAGQDHQIARLDLLSAASLRAGLLHVLPMGDDPLALLRQSGGSVFLRDAAVAPPGNCPPEP